jgi:DNA-binding transcriptional ArsR family regulator
MHANLMRPAAYPRTAYPMAMVGELIGEAGRAAILIALLDGRARTAGELALVANISASSASGHLAKLVGGGLLLGQSSGRHRYYRLAGAEVAQAIEAIGLIATRPVPTGAVTAVATAVGSVQRRQNAEIYLARSCYDHLAGRVAVGMTLALEERNVLRASGERDYVLGRAGSQWFAELGVDIEAARGARRTFARRCLDWTERRPHLAGGLGAALFARMLELGWIARRRESRAVRVTHSGERELGRRLGMVVR